MSKWITLSLILASLTVAPAAPSVTQLQSPAEPGSEAPNLSIAPDGRVLLSWLEPLSPKGYALRFSMREKQAWSVPRTITSGTDWFVSGADYPSVVFMADGTMAANSLITTNLEAEAYNTNILLSHNMGVTWSKTGEWVKQSRRHWNAQHVVDQTEKEVLADVSHCHSAKSSCTNERTEIPLHQGDPGAFHSDIRPGANGDTNLGLRSSRSGSQVKMTGVTMRTCISELTVPPRTGVAKGFMTSAPSEWTT